MLVAMLYTENEENCHKQTEENRDAERTRWGKKKWEVPEARCALGFLDL